jgi:phage tail sheath protein FI
MLGHPDSPGVYIQPVDAGAGRIDAVRTDIAGFAGIAERGPIGVAVAIRSMRQFESVFGSYIGSGYLAYAVRGFFENGGVLCRVCRVAAVEAATASARIRLGDGRFGLTLTASSPGGWGNGILARITPTRRAETLALRSPGARLSEVNSTQGFARFALVRITQDAAELWRIVADVDPAHGLIHWTHPDPAWRAQWEAPLTGLDLGRGFRIERIDYDFAFREHGQLVGVYTALSPVTFAPRFAGAILTLPRALTGAPLDDVAEQALPQAPPPAVAAVTDGSAADWAGVALMVRSGAELAFVGGNDGLALLSPDDYLSRGMAPLEAARDVAMLACPDVNIHPVRIAHDPLVPVPVDPCAPCLLPTAPVAVTTAVEPELPPIFTLDQVHRVQAAMIDQCERLRDRVALIDGPHATADGTALGPGPIRAWRSRFDSGFGILCHPWLATPDPLRRGRTRTVPPSGHIAGQYAATDLAAGFPRAAADRPLVWALAATMTVSPPVHGLLNSEGVNVIAAREGRALRNLGARTMASDPSWRFVPVRRLVSMLRDALDVATQWAVFEPHDDATRMLLRESIAAFLDRLWRLGALVGTTADQAYRVRCDETNNSAADRANGRLAVDVAIAPSAPLEFIVLRVGRQANSFELVEDSASMSAIVGGAA